MSKLWKECCWRVKWNFSFPLALSRGPGLIEDIVASEWGSAGPHQSRSRSSDLRQGYNLHFSVSTIRPRPLPAALPAGKYFSTISEIIWRAEPKICEAICYECSSLLNTEWRGLFEHFLWPMQSSSFMVCGCQVWWRSDGPGPESFHLGSNKNEADPAFCRDVCKPALCKMQNSLRLDKVKHKPHLFNLASERHAKKSIILYLTFR